MGAGDRPGRPILCGEKTEFRGRPDQRSAAARTCLESEVPMQPISRPAVQRCANSASEAMLIEQAAQGDGVAFEAIMRRYNQRLFRVARSILHDNVEAEDVVQDAWLSAWRALGKFRAESGISTWLVRIAVNEAFGRLRQANAQVLPLEVAMMSSEPETRAALTESVERSAERLAERAEMRGQLETLIDRLPESFRTVFILRAIEEMSVEDVAQALDVPEATVRTRFFRARRLLQDSLARHVDMALGDVFSFDGARCDRIVASVLTKGQAEGLCGKP